MESKDLFTRVFYFLKSMERFILTTTTTKKPLGKHSDSFLELTNNRLSLLLTNDSQLQNVTSTYFLTCQYDFKIAVGLC